MVIFGHQDLGRSAPFPRIDLVICRNVLIYFTPELQEYVLNQFAFSLCPNGYLFLGKAETVHPLQTYYELVNKHWKIYRCTGTVLPRVRRPSQATIVRSEARGLISTGRDGTKLLNNSEPLKSSFDIGQLRHFNELLLRFLPIGIVVIERSYHILTANSAARRLLGLRDISSEQDFLHTVRGIPYQEVRNAIDAVFRERNPITLPEVQLEATAGGSGRFMSLSIALMQLENNNADLISVSITDVTEQVQVRRQLEIVQSEQTQLMNELSTVNKRQSDVNKELLDANEELQVANEELVLTHEELQASLEEFETTNEELQATNEELETNNEELQATNEELEATNDELRARSSELQELALVLDSERVHLAEMVELAPFYIMMLRGPNLLVEAYNPSYGRLFEGRSVQGRPLEEVFELFWEPDTGSSIIQLIREVYRLDEARRTPKMRSSRLRSFVEGSEESYFVYNIVPSHEANGRVNGAILYAIDETEQRAQETMQERERLKIIFANTTQTVLALFDARTTQLLMGSPYYIASQSQAKGLTENEMLNMNWLQLADIVTKDERQQLWNTLIEQCTPIQLPEVHYVYPLTGQATIWDYIMTPIIDKEYNNEVRFVLLSGLEVTTQFQAHQELEHLDVLKDEFLAIATHELRTPLTSILGNVQLLQSYVGRQSSTLSQEEVQQLRLEQNALLLDRILHQVNRMRSMIDEMLDVTRIRVQAFDLNYTYDVNIVALLRAVAEQQTSHEHPITLEARAEDIRGSIDEARTEQVLNNLVSNAKKYSADGKPIAITIERSPQNADEVIIAIHDKGVGIAKEEQEHIFDRFYRAHNTEGTKTQGLGLGLYISHEIVVRQGGRIWLESEPGKGSTFYFTLPLKHD